MDFDELTLMKQGGNSPSGENDYSNGGGAILSGSGSAGSSEEAAILRGEFLDEDIPTTVLPLPQVPIPIEKQSRTVGGGGGGGGSAIHHQHHPTLSSSLSSSSLSLGSLYSPPDLSLPSTLPLASMSVGQRNNSVDVMRNPRKNNNNSNNNIFVQSTFPNLNVTIPRTETRKEGGERVILYSIEVRDGNNLITEVKKRFGQLKALHDSLMIRFPNLEQQHPFPNKAMPLFSFSEAQFVQQRKKELETYLRGIAGTPTLANTPELKQFFGFGFEPRIPDILSCHGCLRSAKEGSFEDPRTLISCQHILCAKCCQARLVPSGSAAQRGAGSILSCPVCHAQSPLGPEGIEGLPNSYRVAHMADLVTQMSNLMKNHAPNAPAVVCQNCKKANSAKFCSKCDAAYCLSCYEAVHQIPIFKSHMEPNDNTSTNGAGKRDDLPPVCPVHAKLKEKLNLRVWCRECRRKPLGTLVECKVLVCLQCHYESHRSHDCVNVEIAAVEAKEELSLLIDETKSMANTFESSDQEVRDMVERVQQNYNANVDKINFVFEELIQVLRQRQSHLIGEVSKIRDEKLKALHAQSKQLTNYSADLRAASDAAEHIIKYGSEWEVPLANKVFHDLQVDFNPLTRLPQRTHDDTSVAFVEDLAARAKVFGETTAGPIVGINGNEGAVFWQKLSAPRITSTSIDIPRLSETDSHISLVSSSSSSSLSLVSSSSSSSLNLEFTLGGAATFDPKRKVFWVTNYETKSKSVMLWKIDLDANTSSNVPISSFHGQTGFFSVPVFDGDRYLYITSTTISQDEPSNEGKEGKEETTEQRQEGGEEEEKKKQKKDEENKHSRLVRIDVETLEYQNLTPPKSIIDLYSTSTVADGRFFCISKSGHLMQCTFNDQESQREEEQPEWNENVVEVGTGTSILPHPDDASTLFFVTSSGKIIRYSRLDSSSEEIGVLEDYSSLSSNSSTSPPCSSSPSPTSSSAPSSSDLSLQRLLRNAAVLPSQNTPTHPFFVVSDPQGVLKMYNSHSRSWEVNESWHKCLLTHSSLVYDPTSHSLVYIANDSSWKLIAIR